MANAKDFYVNSDGDLEFQNGDLFLQYSDSEHITDILYSYKGEWKQYPFIGVGIFNYLNSKGTDQQIKNEINTQLKQDNFIIDFVSIDSNFEINIEAYRNEL